MLELLLGIVAALQLALSVSAVGGIAVLTYEGPGSDLGEAITSSGSLPGEVTALILGATSTAAAAVLAEIFDGLTFPAGLYVAGELTLSALLSGTFALILDLFNEFEARAKALASISASIGITPPSVAASIALCLKMKASLKASIAIGMPSVTANLLASIKLRISLIADLVAKITAALSWGTDGFDAFKYEGPGTGLGAALTSRLAGGWPDGASASSPSSVVVLAATTPEATAALTTFFAAAA